MDAKKAADKKPYRQPQVKDYGNIRELTHGDCGTGIQDSFNAGKCS